MKEDIVRIDRPSLSDEPLRMAQERIAKLRDGKGKERADHLRQAMQSLMMELGSVFRDRGGAGEGD